MRSQPRGKLQAFGDGIRGCRRCGESPGLDGARRPGHEVLGVLFCDRCFETMFRKAEECGRPALPHVSGEKGPSDMRVAIEALRRVRDEVEYARSLSEAQYMADKHVTRALVAWRVADPDKCSSAYATRCGRNGLVFALQTALAQVRDALSEVTVDDPDEREQVRQALNAAAKALGEE